MDSQQQQFCLKWNSFGTNLATSFSNLFKSETLADVTLFCDGVSFKAHKLILAACSKHLADLFEMAPPHQSLIVILDGTSAANMSALLEFMYKGEVHVSQDSLSSFLKAAECLQVKGLSIEHEKLAVAQSHSMDTSLDSPTARKHLKVLKEEMENAASNNHHQSSPSPSYSPAMSPYMHPHHYRQYEQRMPATGAAFESAMKRPLRSPSETLHESVRASVLRDGSKTQGRPGSPGSSAGPLSLAFRPSSSCSLPLQPEGGDGPPENRFDPDPATAVVCPESNTSDCCQDTGCAEDLRMKMEPAVQQDEPPSSTGGNTGVTGLSNNASANGSLGQLKFDHDRDKTDMVPASLWNSVAGKLSHKSGTVNTPDGKKLKCPFCERLYGYETNLRAHIRQRHQGIRVPCPFCSRTFTRNNTVRRHIAREHKAELSLKAFQNQQQVQHNHNP